MRIILANHCESHRPVIGIINRVLEGASDLPLQTSTNRNEHAGSTGFETVTGLQTTVAFVSLD
jgi:hypothetical protein